MKYSLFVLFFFLGSSSFGVTFDDLAKKYKATSTEIPIKSVLTITKKDLYNGEIQFHVKRSPYGKMSCKGIAAIENDGKNETFKLKTHAICKSGLEYNHSVNLTDVENFDRFSANVKNTLYEGEVIRVHFEKM